MPLTVVASGNTTSIQPNSCSTSSLVNTTEWSRADILELILSSDVEKTDPFLAQTVDELKHRGGQCNVTWCAHILTVDDMVVPW